MELFPKIEQLGEYINTDLVVRVKKEIVNSDFKTIVNAGEVIKIIRLMADIIESEKYEVTAGKIAIAYVKFGAEGLKKLEIKESHLGKNAYEEFKNKINTYFEIL